MIALLDWALSHWFLLFLLAALGFFDWVRDLTRDIGSGIASVFSVGHRRRMEELRLQVKLEKARAASGEPPAVAAPKPGQCVHRQVAAIIPATEEDPVGWLCKSCGTRLPADWAVREEDL